MDMCYRNPFLKKAIVRIDFTAPIDLQTKSLSRKTSDLILKEFPIPEPKEIIAKNIEISESGTKEVQSIQKHLLFFGLKREKTLYIAPDYAYLDYTGYGTYEKLKAEFFLLLDSINSDFEFSINRFGIRYINQIELSDKEPLEWKSFINDRLICPIEFPDKKETISRCFSSLVQQFDDGMFLNFQYGVFNPDFPSRVKKNQFILDNDAYYQGVMDIEHAKGAIDIAHNRIETNFENAIKDELRIIMGIVKNE